MAHTTSDLKSSTAILFSSRMVVFFIAFVNSIVVSRWLGPEGRGVLVLLLQIPTFIIMCGSLGLGGSGSYHLTKKKTNKADVVTVAVVLSLFLAFFYMAVAGFLFPLLKQNLFKNLPYLGFVLAMGYLPWSLCRVVLRPILLADGRDKLNAFLNIFEQGFIAAATAFVLIVMSKDAVWATGAVGVATAATMLVAYGLYARPIIKSCTFQWQRLFVIAKSMLGYGMWIQIANIFQTINYRIDMFLVNNWQPTAAVGHYSLAVSITEMLRFFPSSLGAVLFPRVASMSESQAALQLPVIFRKLVLVMLPVVICFLVLAKEFVAIFYGNDFLPAAPALFVLMPGLFVLLLITPFSVFIIGHGYVRFNLLSSFIGMLVTIVLDILWIPRYGIMGAAFASALSYLTTAIFIIGFYKYLTKTSLKKLFLFRGSDFSVFRDAVLLFGKYFRRG